MMAPATATTTATTATTTATATTTSSSEKLLLAAVEGGGTSFRLVVFQVEAPSTVSLLSSSLSFAEFVGGQQQEQSITTNVVAQDEFDSDNSPQETLQRCVEFFQKHKSLSGGGGGGKGYAALGIAIFGPVGVHETRKTYGTILSSTPKAIWRNVDFLTPLRQACQGENDKEPIPALVETDVNAPALAEYMRIQFLQQKQQQPNASDEGTISSAAYVTVGTGVGVGLVVNGKTVHGRMHPEGGHVPVQPLDGDPFTGYSWGVQCSPFFGKHTVEGIASSVALTERLLQQQKRQEEQQDGNKNKAVTSTTTTTTRTLADSAQGRSMLADIDNDDDELFDHATNALANLCVTLMLLLSIEKIILGGGLMNRHGLLRKIRARTVTLLNGYLELPPQDPQLNNLITSSAWGKDAGLHGAMVLAQYAWWRRHFGCDGRDDESIVVGVSHPATTTRNKDDKDHDDAERRMKQDAFGIGLMHGMIVGAVITAGIFQWMRNSFRRR